MNCIRIGRVASATEPPNYDHVNTVVRELLEHFSFDAYLEIIGDIVIFGSGFARHRFSLV
jgi:hypothetical protein